MRLRLRTVVETEHSLHDSMQFLGQDRSTRYARESFPPDARTPSTRLGTPAASRLPSPTASPFAAGRCSLSPSGRVPARNLPPSRCRSASAPCALCELFAAHSLRGAKVRQSQPDGRSGRSPLRIRLHCRLRLRALRASALRSLPGRGEILLCRHTASNFFVIIARVSKSEGVELVKGCFRYSYVLVFALRDFRATIYALLHYPWL